MRSSAMGISGAPMGRKITADQRAVLSLAALDWTNGCGKVSIGDLLFVTLRIAGFLNMSGSRRSSHLLKGITARLLRYKGRAGRKRANHFYAPIAEGPRRFAGCVVLRGAFGFWI